MPIQLVHGWSGQVGSIFPISLYGTQDSEVVKKKSTINSICYFDKHPNFTALRYPQKISRIPSS